MSTRLTPNPVCIGICLIFCICSLSSFSRAAEDVSARPAPKEEVFKGLQLDAAAEKKRAEKLAAEQAKKEKELAGLEKKILPLSRDIQDAEQALVGLEEKMKENEVRSEILRQSLKEKQKELSDSLLAALRMRRIPSETLFLQSGAAVDTARTALLLEETLPGLQRRLRFISQATSELTALHRDLERQAIEQKQRIMDLSQEQESLMALITSRQQIIQQTQKDYKLAETKAAALSQEATNLQELMEKVRLQNKINSLKPVRKPEFKKSTEHSFFALGKKNTSPEKKIIPDEAVTSGWPAAGIIRVSFGDKDQFGAASQGIKIETRPRALVTTPMSGKVRYAGPFKNYGRLVIIEHNGGWHSLIAGLDQIHAVTGQSVKNGEPVGTMASQNRLEKLLLYYELRYKGEPVNPSRKIKGLQ